MKKSELKQIIREVITEMDPKVRADILSKDKNHVWGKDGFCIYCHKEHRTDMRPNDLCPKLSKG